MVKISYTKNSPTNLEKKIFKITKTDFFAQERLYSQVAGSILIGRLPLVQGTYDIHNINLSQRLSQFSGSKSFCKG